LQEADLAEVVLKNVVARYEDFLAVDDVCLTIGSGQFVTLLGPSGCGKSTTLRIVAGLKKPTSGSVLFAGRDVTAANAADRNIGMVFQSLALFPHMTVAENVAFGLKMRGVAAAAIDKRVKRMLEMVRLDQLSDRYPSQMSGGQQQRVALARALAVEPSILILDEPFGALDRKLREAMQVELHQLTREMKITALFVTHDQEEALMLSDSIAVMNMGRVEQYGTPQEIYATPNTRFVADFMGMTNFLQGRVIGQDGDSLNISVGEAIVKAPEFANVPGDAEVTFAVRPEKVLLAAADASVKAGIEGTIRQVTYHGDASRIVVSLKNGETIVAVEKNDHRSGDRSVGLKVWAHWAPEDMKVFAQ
jgi:spermidine/putrescine ABC transporter ATP-binding subunit